MCGIVGKYNYGTGEPVGSELINAMCETVIYRGPDDSGVFVNGPVGLGHRRLSILDLSESGHQPMVSTDNRYWITYNGEIYNFPELKKDLETLGYRFKSRCDTEVILCLFQEYGTRCLEYLRGMFAFALWDSQKHTLFLARDRIGKKPLFYYDDGKTLIFASEIKSILVDTAVKKEINYPALYDYFKYLYIPDPKTIFKRIYKLEPGHCLFCSVQGTRKKEYWDVSFARKASGTPDEICRKLNDILLESVRVRMISDVPLGAFLSGGIDSSTVVAMMAQLNQQPVTTCSIGFDHKRFDEIRFAKKVAELYGTDHHEFIVQEDTFSIIKDLPTFFDEPFADASALPTYFVSKLARRKVTVALSGDGGDENFAGYEKYCLDDIENRIRSIIPFFIRKPLFPIMASLFSRRNGIVFRKGETLFNTLAQDSCHGFYLTNTEIQDTLWTELANDDVKKEIGDYNPLQVTSYYYHKADTDDHLSRILYTDLKTYLAGDILVKVDRMSMAHSLEVRAPILDHNVIEYAASIPAALKYNRREKKYVLKQAMKSRLPKEILYRKKMGFSVPLAGWFRNKLKTQVEKSLFAPRSGISFILNPDTVKKIWEHHQSGKRDYATLLWAIYMFELWFKKQNLS